jgi:cellulose synthase/poly-beta-1,6-N-acetylglucosamine synthase-like glycosyltransferase
MITSLPFVTVVVPAYNASNTIQACWQALQRQSYPAEYYEVLVVDDASRDDTVAKLLAVGGVALQAGKLGKSGARNYGARQARGNIVLFTDCDCQAEPDWIRQMVLPFLVQPQVVGVKGAYFSHQTNWVARFTQVECEERYDQMARQRAHINFIDTYAAAYRRATFLQMGGFDESLPELEDQDFSFRLAKQGYQMVFNPQARVWHQHTTSARAYFWRKYRIARWKPLIVQRYPERLWQDSRTPQTLKLQMLFCLPFWGLLPTLGWQFGRRLWFASALAFGLTCLPFLRRTARRDAAILPATLPLLLLRATALAAGYLWGLLRRPTVR